MTPTTLVLTNLLDALAETKSADQGLRQIDTFRRLLVGAGIFSVQLNVTTVDDPKNEIHLQRLYSSEGGVWPVSGRKRKTLTPWTEGLFVRGQVVVTEGRQALADTFDDYETMRTLGLDCAINVPLMSGACCYATFNLFGTCGGWSDEQVVAARMLALAAARWVSPAPGLHYTFTTDSFTPAIAKPAAVAAA